MATTTDHFLERFLRRRDETSFRSLYRARTPALFALALRLTAGRREDAEELVQEAWVRAIERLADFGRRAAFSTWIAGILINCHRELVRRRSRGPRSLDEVGIEDEAERIAARPRPPSPAEPADVERAMARLPDGYREVLVLHDVNGYTHREIAELLAIRTGTSKSQLARARQRLRQLLTDPANAGSSPKGERR